MSAAREIALGIARSWGGPCVKCGHPASYHGMTFCTTQFGAAVNRTCDCDGYQAQRPVPVVGQEGQEARSE